MEFPQEIWCEIMSYFHSTWRRTYHINAITTLISNRPKTGWKRVRDLYDSFYLFLQCDVYLCQRSKKIQFLLIKSPFYIRRAVNKGRIKQDFMDIWENYSKLFPSHHLIRFVRI